MRYQKLFFFATICTMFSCSPTLTPFTRNLYDKNNWSDSDLKRIQFYLSDDLIIYRNIEEGSSQINGGEIKMVDGRKTEQIKFKSGTPGIFLSRPKEDHFAVSFEDGDDTRYLMFGPNPKRNGEYTLLASEWNRKSGKVTYAGEKFNTSSYEIPQLMVNMKYKNSRTVENRKAGGRRVE
jgi:hypothetical protein